jgi:ATP-dependent Clp protease ATP-binding subunit ClpA
MRIDRFTQKMQEALQAAQDVASQHQQQEISNEHFLSTLLDQSEGVTRPLLDKLGVSTSTLKERLEGAGCGLADIPRKRITRRARSRGKGDERDEGRVRQR